MQLKDPEIEKLNQVHEALKSLNKAQIQRILKWAEDRFINSDHVPVGEQAASSLPVDEIHPVPEKKKRTRRVLKEEKPNKTEKPEKIKKAEKTKKTRTRRTKPVEEVVSERVDEGQPVDFSQFESVSEIFKKVKVKRATGLILVTGAFLHEKLKLENFGSKDIAEHLKTASKKINNIAAIVINMMKRGTPLLENIKVEGVNPYWKRLRLTDEGFRMAREIIIKRKDF